MYKNFFKEYLLDNIVGRLVLANVAVYVLLLFIGVFSVLFNVGQLAVYMRSFVELPAYLPHLFFRPWTLLTYMFVHAGPWHLLWNMVALYAFGKIFLNFYSKSHLVLVYLIGGLFGAFFYLAAYNIFPYFHGVLHSSCLVGASASVIAVIVATAVRVPEYRVNMLFVGSVKFSTLAIVTVVLSLLLLSGDNAGGNFAHLGGAFAGWLVAYLLNKGVDFVSIMNRPLQWFSSLFSRPKSKKSKFTYVKGGRNTDYEYNARKKADEAEIDRILEKIKQGGYASLSEDEKKRLFEASSK